MAYQISRWEKVFGDDMRHLRVVGRRIFALLTGLIPFRKWRHRFRDRCDEWMISANRDKIDYFLQHYPVVISAEDTIDRVINGASLVRYNDGEYNLLIGLHKRSYQNLDDQLIERLKDILRSDQPNVLIGITAVDGYSSLGQIWKKFIVRKGNRTLKLFDHNKTYYAGNISGLLWAQGEAFDHNVALFKRIWEKRKVLFVVGKNSRFFFSEELFDNIIEHDFVYAPPKNAFAHYDSILSEVKKYDRDWLVLIALGPAATVLAYDLALDGFQALDFGQTPSIFHKSKYGQRYPEGHHLRLEAEKKSRAVFK